MSSTLTAARPLCSPSARTTGKSNKSAVPRAGALGAFSLFLLKQRRRRECSGRRSSAEARRDRRVRFLPPDRARSRTTPGEQLARCTQGVRECLCLLLPATRERCSSSTSSRTGGQQVCVASRWAPKSGTVTRTIDAVVRVVATRWPRQPWTRHSRSH